MRAFLAINFDLEVVKLLSESVRKIKRNCDKAGYKISWVSPANMHLTLRFMGDIDTAIVKPMEDRLNKEVSKKISPFKLNLEGLGAFPDLDRPHVIWAGVKGDEQNLKNCYQEVNNVLLGLGLEKEEKEFSPHLTIGRIKYDGIRPFKEMLTGETNKSWGESIIKELILYRSELKPEGAQYFTVFRIPFLDNENK